MNLDIERPLVATLITVPLEVLDNILVNCPHSSLLRLYQTCRALRIYLQSRIWKRLYIGPTTRRKRLMDSQGVTICSGNLAEATQLLHNGALAYALQNVKTCQISNGESWPLHFLVSNSHILSNLEEVKIQMNDTACGNYKDVLDVLEAFRDVTTRTVDFTGWNIPPSGPISNHITSLTIHYSYDTSTQISKQQIQQPQQSGLTHMPNVKYFKLVQHETSSRQLHATAMLQLLMGFPQLSTLELDTVRLLNPLALNFIPPTVTKLIWEDRSTSPSIHAFTPPVAVNSVKALVVTTLQAFDLCQYTFPNTKHFEISSFALLKDFHIPRLTRQRIRGLITNAQIQSMMFNLPARFLPDIATTMSTLTLNARYTSNEHIKAAMKACPRVTKVFIDYII